MSIQLQIVYGVYNDMNGNNPAAQFCHLIKQCVYVLYPILVQDTFVFGCV